MFMTSRSLPAPICPGPCHTRKLPGLLKYFASDPGRPTKLLLRKNIFSNLHTVLSLLLILTNPQTMNLITIPIITTFLF